MEVKNTVIIILAVLGIIGCASVIITFLLFVHLQVKQYHVVVFCLTGALCVTSFCTCFGQMAKGTNGCVVLSLTSRMFSLIAVFWATFITFMMYRLAVSGKYFSINWKHCLICTALPCIFTFMPLAGSSCNVAADFCDWCWYAFQDEGRFNEISVWVLIGAFPFIICMFVSAFFVLRVVVLYHYTPAGPVKTCIADLSQKLAIYPIFLTSQIGLSFLRSGLMDYCRGMTGILMAAAFWVSNKEVRYMSVTYYKSLFCSGFRDVSPEPKYRDPLVSIDEFLSQRGPHPLSLSPQSQSPTEGFDPSDKKTDLPKVHRLAPISISRFDREASLGIGLSLMQSGGSKGVSQVPAHLDSL